MQLTFIFDVKLPKYYNWNTSLPGCVYLQVIVMATFSDCNKGTIIQNKELTRPNLSQPYYVQPYFLAFCLELVWIHITKMSKFLLHIETSKHLSIKLYFQLIKMFIVELNDPYVATEKAQVSLIQSKRGLTLITFPGE